MKHFPGHGSSTGDTHLGVVDVTDTWSEVELAPFSALVEDGKADAGGHDQGEKAQITIDLVADEVLEEFSLLRLQWVGEVRLIANGARRRCEAGIAQGRHQHGESDPEPLEVLVPGLELQPVMQPDAAMHPDENDERRLRPGFARPHDPQRVSVVVVDAGIDMGAPESGGVAQEQHRDEQAEGQLHPFMRRYPEAAPADEGGDAQHEMHDEGDEEDGRAGWAASDGDAPLPHRFHGVDRHQADRVIEEMRQGKGEEHETGQKPHLTQAHAPKGWRGRHGDVGLSHADLWKIRGP
ncbi:MAG: hypothetical protein ACREUF_17590 [Solimonas sp.]